jgi:hypothetical protein
MNIVHVPARKFTTPNNDWQTWNRYNMFWGQFPLSSFCIPDSVIPYNYINESASHQFSQSTCIVKNNIVHWIQLLRRSRPSVISSIWRAKWIDRRGPWRRSRTGCYFDLAQQKKSKQPSCVVLFFIPYFLSRLLCPALSIGFLRRTLACFIVSTNSRHYFRFPMAMANDSTTLLWS